jgi:hypothetical protein
MLKEQIVTIPLGSELHQEVDEKLLPAGQAVLEAENVTFDRDGRPGLAKGYNEETPICEPLRADTELRRMHSIIDVRGHTIIGGSVESADGISAHEEFWQCARRVSSVSYLPAGQLPPLEQSRSILQGNLPSESMAGASPTPIRISPDMAMFGTDAWIAWCIPGELWLAAVNRDTGIYTFGPRLVYSAAGIDKPRVVLVGSGMSARIHVLASSTTAFAATLYRVIADPTTHALVSSGVLLTMAPAAPWDACAAQAGLTSGCVIVYQTPTTLDLTLTSYAAGGGVGAWGPIVIAGRLPLPGAAMCLYYTSDLYPMPCVMLSYVDSLVVPQLICEARRVDATFTIELAPQVIMNLSTGAFDAVYRIGICREQLNNDLAAGWDGVAIWFEAVVTVALDERHVRVFEMETDGSQWSWSTMHHYRLLSRPFEYQGRSCAWLAHDDDIERHAALFCLGPQTGTGLGFPRKPVTLGVWNRTVQDRPYGHPCSVGTDGATEPTFFWPSIVQLEEGAQSLALSRAGFTLRNLPKASDGEAALVGGGLVRMSDGQSIQPAGFYHAPRLLRHTAIYGPASGGQLWGGGLYKYIAIYEWTDRLGRIHRSAPSLPLEVRIDSDPFPDGQSLTIPATNAWIDFQIYRTSTLATYSLSAEANPGTYETFDDMLVEVVRVMSIAVHNLWLSLGLKNQTMRWVGVKDGEVRLSYPYTSEATIANDPMRANIMTADWMNEWRFPPAPAAAILWATGAHAANNVGTVLGYSVVADQVAQQLPTSPGIPAYTYICLGDLSLDPLEADEEGRVDIEIDPYQLGDYDRNAEVRIALYRTENNGGTYYHVGDLDNPIESHLLGHVHLDDKIADGELPGRRLPYTSGEPADILENAMPVGWIMIWHRDRAWIVDAEDPRVLWPSKPLAAGVAPEFSEYLKVIMPEPVTAAASFGDVVVALSAERVYALGGEGPDAYGAGSFIPARCVCEAAGAEDHRAVLSAGDLMLWSSERRGLWAMDRGFNAKEIGQQVMGHVQADYHPTRKVISILRRDNVRRIDLLLGDGTAVFFDVRFNRWTVQTGFAGVVAAASPEGSGALFLGAETVGVEGTVWSRAGGLAYIGKVRTGWVHLSGLAGFQRVRREKLICSRRSGYATGKVRLSRFLDYDTVADQVDEETWTDPPQPLVLYSQPAEQKASAVQWLIEILQVDPLLPEAGPYLEAMEIHAAVKRGYSRGGGKDVR